MRDYLEKNVLPEVEKPIRYLGDEFNVIKKDWDKTDIKAVFAFPDVYEVGMSHLGLQILYNIINKKEGLLLERVFAPWPDMEEKLREEKIPLYALESLKSIKEFDFLGFTLQYEMSYSNILNMLDMANIPLLKKERGMEDPIIIGGGPCAFNPEPLCDFFDLFLIGDGEENFVKILELAKRYKKDGKIQKEKFLEAVVGIPGVYVPEFYEVDYSPNGKITSILPINEKAPKTIRKALVEDLEGIDFPDKPIVPYMDVIHDRIMLEVLRGCTHSCRFCQAGTIYRPVRERSKELLLNQAKELVKHTGHEDISLTSLSTADYTELNGLIGVLLEEFKDKKVGISLPSLRTDTFSVELADKISSIRKTGLTFAPEAGTQKMRDVINKGVTEDDLINTVKGTFAAGWHRIKLYFMIGLPFEDYEDLDGIVKLGNKVINIGREIAREKNMKQKITVTISASSFVPKPFTPFQWLGQDPLEILKEKQRYLKDKVRTKNLSFNYHQAELSHMEAAFARGDRRLGKVLYSAFQKGCRFDGWDDWFDFDRWQEAFRENGFTSEEFAQRIFDKEDILPWDHIDSGVRKSYLWREFEKAKEETLTPDCREAGCTGCGICKDFNVEMKLVGEKHV